MTRHGEHRAGIYAIEHIATGRLYVGSSSNISQRWADHQYSLNRGTHKNTRLQAAWSESGADAFILNVLEVCERDRAILASREQVYINKLRPVFNRRPVATRSTLGVKLPRTGITECPQGHPYNEANTGYSTRHQRYCRECARLRVTAKYVPKTVRRNGPTCKRGHEWTPENTITLASGNRQCRACAALRQQERNERTRERYNSGPELRERRRADHERHREERLAQMREHGREVREAKRAERLAHPTIRTTCRKGHPWTPENTIQWKGKQLCRTCRDASRAETPEQHEQRLARRRERERAGYHEANQRAYQRRLARQKAVT